MRARANGKKNKGKSKGNISTRKRMRSPKKEGGQKGKNRKVRREKKNVISTRLLFVVGQLDKKKKERMEKKEEHCFHKAPVRWRWIEKKEEKKEKKKEEKNTVSTRPLSVAAHLVRKGPDLHTCEYQPMPSHIRV
jgi:hypothetical protein